MNPFARRAVPAVILIITTFASAVAAEEAPPLPAFDFRQTAIVSQWRAAHDIQSLTATAVGTWW